MAKTVKDVPADKFVKEYAAHLKQADKLQLPAWVEIVKTAHWKELSPYDPDWYYTRAASVARHVYLKQGLGVGKLRKVYGTETGAAAVVEEGCGSMSDWCCLEPRECWGRGSRRREHMHPARSRGEPR